MQTMGDLNYPSFAVRFEANSQNLNALYKRTVTNVRHPRTTYVVQVQESKGVSVIVEPKVLKFRHTGQKLNYKVRFVESGEKSSSSDTFFVGILNV